MCRSKAAKVFCFFSIVVFYRCACK
uniref:Uncharacterized protein n=1 Tax=Anguilla anguilla TaxID=7936 RepID=A0A0E9TEZ3_ANGAN